MWRMIGLAICLGMLSGCECLPPSEVTCWADLARNRGCCMWSTGEVTCGSEQPAAECTLVGEL